MEQLQTWWVTALYMPIDGDSCMEIPGDCEVVKAADAQATIAALEQRVKELKQWVQDQSTANLETMRHTDEMQSRALEAEQQLTQRTAELEAAKASQAIDLKNNNAYREQVATLQAELERVRGLVKALPKVEGQFEVGSGACYYVRALDGKSNPIVCGLMTEQAVAYAILALLKHRQGMEGYP